MLGTPQPDLILSHSSLQRRSRDGQIPGDPELPQLTLGRTPLRSGPDGGQMAQQSKGPQGLDLVQPQPAGQWGPASRPAPPAPPAAAGRCRRRHPAGPRPPMPGAGRSSPPAAGAPAGAPSGTGPAPLPSPPSGARAPRHPVPAGRPAPGAACREVVNVLPSPSHRAASTGCSSAPLGRRRKETPPGMARLSTNSLEKAGWAR